MARLRVPHDLADRVQDLLPPPVRDREVERVVLVVLRPGLRVRDRLLHVLREQVPVPEHLDLDPVPVPPLVVPDPAEVLREQPHQAPDLLRRPGEVLRGERVHGEDPHAHVQAPLQDLLELVPPLRVAHPGVPEAELLREPPVPVHDDCDVAGDGRAPHLVQEPVLVRLVRGVADDLGDVRGHRGQGTHRNERI